MAGWKACPTTFSQIHEKPLVELTQTLFQNQRESLFLPGVFRRLLGRYFFRRLVRPFGG